MKLYRFTISNQELRKYVCEIQKDSQKLVISRDFSLVCGKDAIMQKQLK